MQRIPLIKDEVFLSKTFSTSSVLLRTKINGRINAIEKNIRININLLNHYK
jgi:hypothetical protein